MAREIVAAARFPNKVVDQVTEVHVKLWRVFATLVKVNPLVKTADGAVLALEAKVTLDDNARFSSPRPCRAG